MITDEGDQIRKLVGIRDSDRESTEGDSGKVLFIVELYYRCTHSVKTLRNVRVCFRYFLVLCCANSEERKIICVSQFFKQDDCKREEERLDFTDKTS